MEACQIEICEISTTSKRLRMHSFIGARSSILYAVTTSLSMKGLLMGRIATEPFTDSESGFSHRFRYHEVCCATHDLRIPFCHGSGSIGFDIIFIAKSRHRLHDCNNVRLDRICMR